MLTFVNRRALSNPHLLTSEQHSTLKHRHFRLDVYLSDRRISVGEVYRLASMVLGKRISKVADILALTLSEHDRLEDAFREKYGV